MNSQTLHAWMKELGYVWVEDEHFVKGFMTRSEAQEFLDAYEMRGYIKRG
jgi:hypothetical protein